MALFCISIKKTKDESINIINSRSKLPFLVDKKNNKKDKIEHQLTKLSGKLTNIAWQKAIENVSILCVKKGKYIGQKRMRSKVIVDTIFIKELHDFDNYNTPNPTKCK